VWGHGTFGIADVCAPSWSKPNERDGTFIDAWLRQGYAVVAPDYQGLGTRGVHPYLQRKPEGYSTLDAARAALAAHPKQIANRVILAGQSQGSGAVLNATYLAKGYAPSLNILGTVATALVWRAPGTSNPAEEITGSDSARYMIMRMMSGGLPDSAPAPDALLTDKGALLRETASAHCSRDLVPVARDNAITSTNAVNIPAEKVMTMLSSLDMPPGRLTIPIFIGTGRADEAIAPQSQYRTVREMCRRGDRIIWHTYSGVGHSATSISALRDSIPFANALLKGAKPSSTCASIADPGARQAPARDIPFNN
jgi:alpha-beta hydrolase superfamily lysophospholipase